MPAGVGDADVFALAAKGGQMGVQAFFIRGGQNWGHRAIFPKNTGEVDEAEVLADVLLQFYEEVPPPKTILVDRELPEQDLISEALCEKAGHGVLISIPQRGTRRKLMAQASRNAVESLERRLAESGTKAKTMREMADFLELEDVPQRIEIYDNSHIQGDKALGAMVVASPEGFEKGQYRKFNIKTARSDDDFAMMREVMQRRFRKLAEEDFGADGGGASTAPEAETPARATSRTGGHETVWPDLVLLDGGKGQMSSVRNTLEEMGIENVPLIAIAKGPHHGREGREVFHFPDGREKTLPVNSPLLFYLQNPARRGPPLCHRRAPRQAQPRHHRFAAGRDPGHRPVTQARAAAPFRDGRKSPRRRARRSEARTRYQRQRGATYLRLLSRRGMTPRQVHYIAKGSLWRRRRS